MKTIAENKHTSFLDTNKMTLQDKIDYIASKAIKLNTVNGAIELNPDNPSDAEWYYEDEGEQD